MSDSNQKQLLKKFHRSLNDRPISQDDPFYVGIYEQASSDPIEEIATNILFSESSSVSLLSGHRGSGKSTQILRLKKLLEQEDAAVFLVDISQYLNLSTPVDITDFLITLMTAFNEQVHDLYSENIAKEDYLTRLDNFLKQEVNISELGFSWSGSNIKASLKSDPSFKKQLQEKLKGHAAAIIRKAHDFVREVVDKVRTAEKDEDKKVVLLVDSIEQIRGIGEDAPNVYNSVENLFNVHATSLNLPHLHTLFTLPPYLSPLAPNLATVLGSNALFNLPSIHIKDQNDQPDTQGLLLMQTMVEKRFNEWNFVFTKQQLDKISLLSGGDLRNFFRLIRTCIIKKGAKYETDLPIEDSIITLTEQQLSSEVFLAEQDKMWLRKIHETKQHQLNDIKSLPQLARFLDSGLILNYRNGEEWYDVHPVVLKKLN